MAMQRRPRKLQPQTDPVAGRIRALRVARGLSYEALGRRVGTAASHIFHVENGEKLPSEDLAAKLARALGDDVELYRAWVRAIGKSDFRSTVEAATVLRRLADAPSAGLAVSGGAPGPARFLIPVIAKGEDPGDSPHRRPATSTLRVDAADVGPVERLEHPFAIPLTSGLVTRVLDALPASGWAILTRRVLPLEPGAIYAVRAGGWITLARVQWNGAQLLLLATQGAHDFVVLDAPDEAALAARLAGVVVAVRARD